MHVLVVEDDVLQGLALTDLLESAGYFVTWVTNLVDFQTALLTLPKPDAIISDGDLGKHTVMDIRGFLTSQTGFETIPFILHTGSHATAKIRTAYAEAYPGEPVWVKPEPQLLRKLEKLMLFFVPSSFLEEEARA